MTTSDAPHMDLPNDILTLQRMVQQLLSDVHEKTRQIVDLQNQLDWFKRHMFGRRSEKLDTNQLTLFEGMTDTQQQEEGASEESDPTPARVAEKW